MSLDLGRTLSRWHAHRQSTGSGHVYQGRFKSFPIQEDQHLFTAARYVERNALRANLTARAEDWRWGSLFRWQRGSAEDRRLLSAWPMPRPANWLAHVNAPQTDAELAALRRCVNRGNPYGAESWSDQTVRSLGLNRQFRPAAAGRKSRQMVPLAFARLVDNGLKQQHARKALPSGGGRSSGPGYFVPHVHAQERQAIKPRLPSSWGSAARSQCT